MGIAEVFIIGGRRTDLQDLGTQIAHGDPPGHWTSLNIAHTMDSPDFGRTIATAVRALTAVSDMSHIRSSL
jgi:hypothetical protein